MVELSGIRLRTLHTNLDTQGKYSPDHKFRVRGFQDSYLPYIPGTNLGKPEIQGHRIYQVVELWGNRLRILHTNLDTRGNVYSPGHKYRVLEFQDSCLLNIQGTNQDIQGKLYSGHRCLDRVRLDSFPMDILHTSQGTLVFQDIYFLGHIFLVGDYQDKYRRGKWDTNRV